MSKQKDAPKGRGKEPSQLTKFRLFSNTGGRCQFSGCNKKLFIDNVTLKALNNTNIAHIVASSPEGPRGNENSYNLSDKLENLMLMCQEHHKLIDEYPEKFTIEKLCEMKNKQEKEVEKLLDEMNYPETEIIIFESLIKNKHDVRLNIEQAVEAIHTQGKKPASRQGIPIRIECTDNYISERYWKNVEKQLEDKVRYLIETLYHYDHDLMLSVFPLASIPLIIKLGNILGDKKIIDIYQKTRIPDTWIWQSTEPTNKFVIEKTIVGNNGNKVALILSLTTEIDLERVTTVLNDVDIIYHLKAERNDVDCIKSLDDLRNFWQKFQVICDQIKNEDKIEEVSIFPAVPVSAAFEIGRRHMLGVHPVMSIYDEDNGFFKTITIGGIKSINE